MHIYQVDVYHHVHHQVLKKQAEIVIESTVASHDKYIAATKEQRVFLPEIAIDDLEQVSDRAGVCLCVSVCVCACLCVSVCLPCVGSACLCTCVGA